MNPPEALSPSTPTAMTDLAVLRRDEIHLRYDSARIQVALDRLLSAPARRVSVKPLVIESWRLRNNLTVADALYVVIGQHLSAPLVTTDL